MSSGSYTYLLKLVHVSALGLILFFVLELISRRYTFALLQRALCWTAGAVLLDEVHGLESIRLWFSVDVDSALARHQEPLKAQRIYDRNQAVVVMELDYRQESYPGGDLIYFNAEQSQQQEVWHVSGYDYMLNFHVGTEKISQDQAVIGNRFMLGDDSLRVEYQPGKAGQAEALRFAYTGDTVALALQPLFSRAGAK